MAEVLRGARDLADFDRLYEELMGAQFLDDTEETWLRASRILLDLKLRGAILPFPDAEIAAVALAGDHSVYSSDEHFARIPGLRLHSPPTAGST
jgi:predicted nucleic acid-binding protein